MHPTTEQLLRQLFKNSSNCYADADGVIMAMDEDCFISIIEEAMSICAGWNAYNSLNPDTLRPSKYGKYLVCRKDGNIHFEVWNGTGWAYNGNSIKYWMEVKLPAPK